MINKLQAFMNWCLHRIELKCYDKFTIAELMEITKHLSANLEVRKIYGHWIECTLRKTVNSIYSIL